MENLHSNKREENLDNKYRKLNEPDKIVPEQIPMIHRECCQPGPGGITGNENRER